MNNWREVTRTEFYQTIGPQNVHPSVIGGWPYISYFKTPHGEVRGISEDYLPEGKGIEQTRYYLPNEEFYFLNRYKHCGQVWEDHWSCACNDRCPICNAEIEPFESHQYKFKN